MEQDFCNLRSATRTRRTMNTRAWAIALFALLLTRPLQAQLTTQSFSLQSGWNSIWLEVTPTNNDVNVVFAGVPVESVWTFQARLTAVDFIQDPSEPVWNRDRWLVHVPTNRFESLNNNLFTVSALRAYLVKVTAPATFTITGRPSLRHLAWAPDAFNLRGFPIDPGIPPAFNSFFRYSPAHFNSVSNRLERIYKLSSSGQWTLAGPGELMQRGIAYWVYCRGGSEYQAPFEVQIEASDRIDFGDGVEQVTVQLLNRTTANITGTLRDQLVPTPISYASFNPTNGVVWSPLPSPLAQAVSTAQPQPVRLAIRRGAMASEEYGSVLEVKNGAGVRYLVPVTASRQAQVAGNSAANYAGLWAGTATISAVNEVNSPTNATAPTPVSADFTLRLLLHVDDSGATRLLREVIQLWQDGTYTTDAEGRQVVDTPGHYLLVTDHRLIPALKGVSLRDGQPVGRRLSTAYFDFPTTPDENYLSLNGSFGGTNSLSASFTLSPTFPTNPFRHKFHPDHDNLDATFQNFRAESYQIARSFTLAFSPTNTAGAATPDYGYQAVAGTYRETVTGLHRAAIHASGPFRLTRVSEIGVLNR